MTFDDCERRYRKDLFNFAYRLTGSVQESDDLTQTTLINAHRKFSDFRNECDTRTWLFYILRNAWRDAVRAKRRQRVVSFDGIDSGTEYAEYFHAPDPFIDTDAWNMTINILDRMPQTYKEAILASIHQENDADAAKSLGLSLSNFKSRLGRGRSYARSMIQSSGMILANTA